MTHELLTVDEMYEADRLTMADHVPGVELMENAGRACADAICERVEKGHVTILCGPGNNGGDGFVIARLLQMRGWAVRLALLGDKATLKGDAAVMAGKLAKEIKCDVLPLTSDMGEGTDLIVDALFGAGLSKPVTGVVAETLARAETSGAILMAVDVPSGMDGNSGQVLKDDTGGFAPHVDFTVTFARKKVGHVLMPGRAMCGELIVADIGIPDEVIAEIAPLASENALNHWWPHFPELEEDGHKYTRGHALVVSGGVSSTGAARLAARGALRIGAGLVTVASPPNALMVNASQLLSVMVKSFEESDGLAELLKDSRKNAVGIGPGAGVRDATCDLVRAVLASEAACVLDADALTSFEKKPKQLYEIAHLKTVLTPHIGEFKRIFPNLLESSVCKVEAAQKAAKESGAIVVLKGPDTVIASPDGQAAVNTHAHPALATAGSGDVLTGFITGLLAQHMPPFEAACAGVWLHGACGEALGRGLIAEDLPEVLPEILQVLDETMGDALSEDAFWDED